MIQAHVLYQPSQKFYNDYKLEICFIKKDVQDLINNDRCGIKTMLEHNPPIIHGKCSAGLRSAFAHMRSAGGTQTCDVHDYASLLIAEACYPKEHSHKNKTV